jgi:amino acid permease
MTILTDSSSTRQQGITSWQAFIHLLKGYVGPGCLSLPWAISQLGVPLGVIVVFVVSYWTSMNIWHVVELKRVYETSLPPSSRNYPISYPDVGNWLYGKRFARFLTAMICVQQLAVCTVFLSFIGENLGAAIRHSIGDMSHTLVITLVLPAAIGLTCLPNLKVLVPVMTLATLALFAGFAVLSVLVVQQWPDRPQPYPTEIQQWGNVPLAICAVLYSFEGVCLILPIETSMADSKQFAKVFCSAMAASAVIFALVGALCVMAFGPISSGSITAFLLEQAEGGDLEVLYMANTLVSVAVLLTYPLQLFPSYELVGPVMANYFGTRIPEEDDQEYGSVAMHHVGTHNGYVEASSDDGGAIAAALTASQAPFSDEEPLATDGIREATSQIQEEEQDYSNSFGTSYGDTPAVRVGLVLVTYMFAIVVPNVQLLVSLAGAVSGSATGLLVPPLLQLAYWKQTERQEGWHQVDDDNSNETSPRASFGSWYYQRRRMQCYLLFLLGCIVLIIGTTASLRDIIRVYTGMEDR